MEKRGITNKTVTKKIIIIKMFNFRLSNVSWKTLLILKKTKQISCSSSLFIWKIQKSLSISRIGVCYDGFRIIKINHDFLYITIWRLSKCLILYWLCKNQPLYYAFEKGHLSIVQYLIAKGAILVQKTRKPRGYLQIVQFLSEAGDDIKAKNKNYNTPLY